MAYLCDPVITPAFMPENLAAFIADATQAARFARGIHLDVMDGSFVPSVGWPLSSDAARAELERLAARADALPLRDMLEYEVHLMVRDPLLIGEAFARAGFARIIAHLEAFGTPREAVAALDVWRARGAHKAGLALLLDTPLHALEGIIASCDVVQIMSITEVGYQGTSFDERAILRIEELHANHPNVPIAIDGGITDATIEDAVRAGANRLIVGSALRDSADPAAAYADLYARAQRGCGPRAAV